jgi:AcrR family transcriptional regulator
LSRGPRLAAEDRRRQLLEVAIEVFGTDGFHDTGMHDIAQRAGVTKPVLYQHFASKQDLYTAVVAEAAQLMREAIGKAVAEANGPRDQVERGFRAFVHFLTNEPATFRVLFAEANRADDTIARLVRETENAIAEHITSLIVVPTIAEEQRRVIAHAIVGLAEGASRHWAQSPSELDPERLAKLLADFAWAGLRGERR